MDFTKVLNRVGDYGRCQKILIFVFFHLINAYGSLSYWGQIFILLVPDYTCNLAGHARNGTVEGVDLLQCGGKSLTNEYASDTNSSVFETFLPARGLPVYMASFFGMGRYFDDNNTRMTTEQTLTCDSWTYDYSILFPTIASENNWVCQESWKVSFAHTCYWIGSTIGYLIAGFILDSMGRKFSTGFFATTLGISHIASIFAPNYVTFVFCRLVSGMSALPMQSSSYTLIMELIGPSKRKVVAVTSAIYWLGLAVVFPWMAYVIRDWKILLILSSSPIVVILPMIILWVPESPSWLLGRGDIQRCKSELIRISKINGTFEADFFDTLKLVEPKVSNSPPEGFLKTTLSLFGSRNIRKNTSLLFFAWLFICMSYHGVNLSQSSAGSHVYVIYSLGSLLEIPVCFLHLSIVDRIGRRLPIILSLVLVGIIGSATSSMNSDSLWVGFSVSIVIRGLFSLAYNIFFQLANEIFPTSLRGRGVCLMRMLGDIGTSVSPFIISNTASQPALPVFIFSGLAVVGAVVTLGLPETLNQPLPQTVQDADEFGLDQGIFFCPILNKKTNTGQALKDKELGNVNPAFTLSQSDLQGHQIV